MHVRQELYDSHHTSTHTNIQGSLMDTEKMLLHCIFRFIPVKFIMGPAAFGNASFGPPTNDDKSSHFSELLITKYISFIWNSEFSTILFGQIMSPSFGTIHWLKRNHYGVNGDVGKTQQI